MTAKKSSITAKDILMLGIVAGGGYVAYKFIKGDWSFPNVLGAIGSAPQYILPGDIGQGYGEGYEQGGIPGAIGGVEYNIFRPGGESLGTAVHERTKYIQTQQPGLTWLQAQDKATAQVVSEDIIANPWLSLLPFTSAGTIGAGLGAMKRWTDYLNTLPPQKRKEERQQEYSKRLKFIGKNILSPTPKGVLTRVGAPINILHMALTWPGSPKKKKKIHLKPSRPTKTGKMIAELKQGKLTSHQFILGLMARRLRLRGKNG